MSRLVIVPNSLRDAINAKLEAAYETCPAARADHEYLFSVLLGHVDEHGTIPDITLTPKHEDQ